MSDNDILLHALEEVLFGIDGGLGEDLGGLLEGGGGDEGLGLEGGTGDTLEDLLGGGRTGLTGRDELLVLTTEQGVLVAELTGRDNLAVFEVLAVTLVIDDLHAEDLVVDLAEVDLVDQLAFEEAGVAGVFDLDLAHHLTDDDFEVLVVDLHALETIDLLDLVDDVLLDLHRALDGEDVGRGDGAFGERGASLDIVLILSKDLLGGGDEVGTLLAGLGGDGDLTVVAFEFFVDGDDAVDFGDDGGVGGVAGLEELGDTRKTAGDIASLAEGTWDLDHDVAGLEFLTLLDTDMCADGEVIDLEDVALGVDDVEGGVLGTLTGLDDDLVLKAGLGVGLDTVGDVLDDVLEVYSTGDIGDDDGIVGVPFGDEVALGEEVAGGLVEFGAVRDKCGEEGDVGLDIDDTHLSGTAHDDVIGSAFGVGIGDETEFVDFETAFIFGLEGGGGTDVATGDAADVEGTEGKLCTWLADSLSGDDADRLAFLDHVARGEVAAVALGTDTMTGLAGEDGTDFDLFDRRFLDLAADVFGEFFTGTDDEFVGEGVIDVVDGGTTEDAFAERLNDVLALLEGGGGETAEGAAVLFGDDDIVGDIDETTGEVASVGRFQSGIGETLTGAVGRDEVFEHRKTLLEVGDDGVFDNLVAGGTSLLRLGHKATHTGELTDLFLGTTSTRVVHHIDGVEALVVGLEAFHEGLGELVVGVGPDVDDVVVAFVVGDKTHGVLSQDLIDLLVGASNHLLLFGRDEDVAEVEGEAAAESLAVAHVLDVVEEVGGGGVATGGEEVADDVAEGLLAQDHIDEAIFGGDDLVEDDATDGGAEAVGLDIVAFGVEDGIALLVADNLELGAATLGHFGGRGAVDVGEEVALAVLDDLGEGVVGLDEVELVAAVGGSEADAYAGVLRDAAFVESDDDLFGGIEAGAFTLDSLGVGGAARLRGIVETQNHVLRRHGDRGAVGRVEDVVGREHEDLRFEDGGVAERDVDSHLVAIEVGIETGTDERVETDGLAFDELGLEGLDAETVERRSTVEEDGMALEDVFEDFPNDGILAVNDTLGGLDGLDEAAFEHLADDEGFEKFGGHVLGEAALVHLEFGADDDDRTAGIVNTLAEEVLTEAALLALEGVGERLEGAVGVGLDAGGLTAVVEEGVNGFLKHTFFVAHDDFGSLYLHEPFETVVADDDTTIEFVDVGGGETAAVERDEGTQVGRDDRDNVEDHPFGTVVHTTGLHTFLRLAERLDDVETFEDVLFALVGGFLGGAVAEFEGEFVEIDFAEELVEGLGTHAGDELVGVGVVEEVVAFGEFLGDGVVFLFAEEVEFVDRVVVEGGDARLDNDIFLIVDYLVEFFGRDVEEGSNLVGERAEEPDVGDGDGEFDMAHTFAADLFFGDFDAAAVADDALVADAFVLAAVALPVAGGAEDLFAEEAVAFGLIGAVVDGLGLSHLAIGAFLDGLRGGEGDGD